VAAPSTCVECGTELSPSALACPRCRRLRHRDELNALSAAAGRATEAGDLSGALAAWRTAIDLIPPQTRQHEQVLAKIQTLSRGVDAPAGAPAGEPNAGTKKGVAAGGATGLALLLWKFKFAIAFVLTKGKLLLLGFTKLSTVLSMLLSLGVYWAMFGWKFAAGLILSLYVHEMGHVTSLKKYGIAASAPMFIPGFGALVRLKQYPANPVEDARVGLAGPIYGFGAAVVAAAIAFVTDSPVMFAIAKTGAWLNLFNLVPIWQLDGGRAFRALKKSERWIVVGAIGATWFLSGDSMLVLLLLGAVFRAFEKTAPAEGDRRTLVQYVLLVAALAAMCSVTVKT
jgi:Zn-dependent protease